MRRLTLDNVFMVVLSVCAVTVTALLARRELSPNGPVQPANEHVANWRALTTHGNSLGPVNAAATLIIFSDFECPFCRQFAATTDSLRVKHPDLRVVEINFPLTNIHPHALGAALAGECAASMGRYSAVREVLFAREDLLQRAAWGAIASQGGIADTAALVKCMRTPDALARVVADTLVGHNMGVNGTPTVFVNNLRFGIPPTPILAEAAVSRALAPEHLP